MKYAVALAAAASALALSAPAAAAPYIFTLTGDYSANFQLDSNPTPDSYLGYKFVLNNVTGTFPGLTGSYVTLDFYTAFGGGGFTASDQSTSVVLVDPYGTQLFTGDTSAPEFVLGTYNLLNNANNGAPVQLVISAATAPVPEPATWAMMISGFGLVGGALRRRTNVRVAYAA
jgi:hypothetical protein